MQWSYSPTRHNHPGRQHPWWLAIKIENRLLLRCWCILIVWWIAGFAGWDFRCSSPPFLTGYLVDFIGMPAHLNISVLPVNKKSRMPDWTGQLKLQGAQWITAPSWIRGIPQLEQTSGGISWLVWFGIIDKGTIRPEQYYLWSILFKADIALKLNSTPNIYTRGRKTDRFVS